jgi:hypothetical protein
MNSGIEYPEWKMSHKLMAVIFDIVTAFCFDLGEKVSSLFDKKISAIINKYWNRERWYYPRHEEVRLFSDQTFFGYY